MVTCVNGLDSHTTPQSLLTTSPCHIPKDRNKLCEPKLSDTSFHCTATSYSPIFRAQVTKTDWFMVKACTATIGLFVIYIDNDMKVCYRFYPIGKVHYFEEWENEILIPRSFDVSPPNIPKLNLQLYCILMIHINEHFRPINSDKVYINSGIQWLSVCQLYLHNTIVTYARKDGQQMDINPGDEMQVNYRAVFNDTVALQSSVSASTFISLLSPHLTELLHEVTSRIETTASHSTCGSSPSQLNPILQQQLEK
jgi:hypothetical protein